MSWKILDSEWVRKITRVESLGAFGDQAWRTVTNVFTWGGLVIGGLAGLAEGYGWVGVAVIAFGLALTGALAVFLVAAARTFWLAPGKTSVDQPGGGDRAAMSGTVRDSQSFDQRGLYVGDMKVSGSDFEQSHQLEISIRGFNATGCRLAFPSTVGNIEYEAKVKKEVVASGQLLTPSIIRDKRNTWENENNSEFNLVFTQPLDPKAVKGIADCLEKDGTVFFELHNLDIRAAPTDDHSNSARLPVWDGITLRKPATRYVSGRVISARMGLGAFSMKASSPDAKS